MCKDVSECGVVFCWEQILKRGFVFSLHHPLGSIYCRVVLENIVSHVEECNSTLLTVFFMLSLIYVLIADLQFHNYFYFFILEKAVAVLSSISLLRRLIFNNIKHYYIYYFLLLTQKIYY